MTYKEVINAIQLDGIEIIATLPRMYSFSQGLKKAEEALKRAEKYRWHDIRKDKTDLPDVESSKDYLFENKWGQIFKGTFRVVGNHKFFEAYIHDKVHGDIYLQCKICNVTRWSEIEPFL